MSAGGYSAAAVAALNGWTAYNKSRAEASALESEALTAEQNAYFAEQEVDRAIARGEFAGDRLQEAFVQYKKQGRAEAAHAGVAVGVGSAAVAEDAAERNAEKDLYQIRMNAMHEAQGFQREAFNSRLAASEARLQKASKSDSRGAAVASALGSFIGSKGGQDSIRSRGKK